MDPEEMVDFCLTRSGYCNCMAGREPVGHPCVEFVCFVCKDTFKPPQHTCDFCKGVENAKI